MCHLYSLQQQIVLVDIYTFYLVDWLTCLDHKHPTKLDWIQSTHLNIYTSFNEAKSDPIHPVWSIVNECFTHKHPCWRILVNYDMHGNISSLKNSSLINEYLLTKQKGFDSIKFVLFFCHVWKWWKVRQRMEQVWFWGSVWQQLVQVKHYVLEFPRVYLWLLWVGYVTSFLFKLDSTAVAATLV